MKLNGKNMFYILLGMAVSAGIIFLVLFYFQVVNFEVFIFNPKYTSTDVYFSDFQQAIEKMHRDGIILTPAEYTSNLSSYYNSLIAILVFLFIFFSFLSYFQIKLNLKEQINIAVENEISKSTKFSELIEENIEALVSDKFVDLETFEEVVMEADREYVRLVSYTEDKEFILAELERLKS